MKVHSSFQRCQEEGVNLLRFLQAPHWLLPLWVCFSLAAIFSLLMWQPSTGAGLNIFDILISLPSLLILVPLMVKRGWIGKRFLLAAAPLAAYLAFTLGSLTWADSPNVSRTFRAAGQVTAIFVLFSYLQCSGKTLLLQRGLLLACAGTAILSAWHLIVIYGILGAPWETPLYQGIERQQLEAFGVQPINAMLATLLIAPQAAMLLGLTVSETNKSLRYVGLSGLAVLLVFLVELERRTGQVAILVAIAACIVLYRNRIWYLLLGGAILAALITLIFFPEFILSRGFSWRPAIWLSTLEAIGNAPFFGHGIRNEVTPVAVFDYEQGVTRYFRHPHNMALSVTYFLGITGLILWALLWVPGVLTKIRTRPEYQHEGYILIPMFTGIAALMFDSGDPLSPFHFDWFCFWIPATLLLSSQAAKGQHMFAWRRRPGHPAPTPSVQHS